MELTAGNGSISAISYYDPKELFELDFWNKYLKYRYVFR